MLHWIAHVLSEAKSKVEHYAWETLHALITAVAGTAHTVWGNVGDAWADVIDGADLVWHSVSGLAEDTYHAVAHVVRVQVPNVWHWAEHHVAAVASDLAGAVKWTARQLVVLEHTARHLVDSAVQWVQVHVYDPLAHAVGSLWDAVDRWAKPAWHAVTHPDSIIDGIAAALGRWVGRNAWSLARTGGDWATKVVLANLPRLIGLVEQIIADVL